MNESGPGPRASCLPADGWQSRRKNVLRGQPAMIRTSYVRAEARALQRSSFFCSLFSRAFRKRSHVQQNVFARTLELITASVAFHVVDCCAPRGAFAQRLGNGHVLPAGYACDHLHGMWASRIVHAGISRAISRILCPPTERFHGIVNDPCKSLQVPSWYWNTRREAKDTVMETNRRPG